MKRRTYSFVSDIYQKRFYFCPGFSVKDYEDTMKGKFGSKFSGEIQGDMEGLTVDIEQESIVIWTRTDKLESIPALVHECVHAANFAFIDKGIKYSSEEDESLAYFVEWIFNKCMKKMKVK